MTIQELKSYIDRILGNSLRCLLPSYWWKRAFGVVIDAVEAVDKKVNSVSDKTNESIEALTESLSSLEEVVNSSNGYTFVLPYGGPMLSDKEKDLNKQALLTIKGSYDKKPVTACLKLPNAKYYFVPIERWASTKIHIFYSGVIMTFTLNEDGEAALESSNYLREEMKIYVEGKQILGAGTLTDSDKAENIKAYNLLYPAASSSAYNLDRYDFRILMRKGEYGILQLPCHMPLGLTSGTDKETGQPCIAFTISLAQGTDLAGTTWYVHVFADGSVKVGQSTTIDSELSEDSSRPVQNKVVTAALNAKADKTYVDEQITDLTNEMIANEEVVAAAFNDLNDRLNEIITRLNNAGL